ncbi:MAG: penicillin-binding protein, partial [Muribaculaceae bacterium]|nr:penicillin-binding protein [Muribaculaceae bacterium]
GVPYNLTAQIGGKTGTTNFNSDSWFMAFTPELVAGTWVGGEERFIHFTSTSIGQGAASALPIYGKFIRKVFNDSSLPYSQSTTFEFPAGIDLCDGLPPENYGGDSGEQEVAEESFEGAFD